MSDSAQTSGADHSAHRVFVKICGITNLDDALEAIDCGADALGFNLYPGSKRFIELEQAAQWIAQIPPGVGKVAVMVNPTLDAALRAARLNLFDSMQLHGHESPEFCRDLAGAGISFTKALPMKDEKSLNQPTKFFTRNVLLDSVTAHGFGGTGRTFPWSLARRFVEAHPALWVILAGGLTPENVGEAIATVRPAGVDVTGGVEAEIGRKDSERLRAFIAAAKGA